ncbi:MAG TPA: SBBP repeat-containing protein [Myxococcaceae bacterium]|nr:SBBP repeat-containing protein [Myxococcaceae bacterium]
MHLLTSRVRTLALAVSMLTVAFGAGCNNAKNDGPKSANAKISVSGAAVQSDIQSIQISITDSAPPAAPSAGFPIVALLTKAPAGNVWTANVTGIPANPAPGSTRYFQATAYAGPNATGAVLYQGTTPATVIAGQTAQVTILLQEVNPPAGPSNYAPVIDSVTSSAAYLLPGQGGSFTVTAHDPDNASHLNRPQFNGEPLAYAWSATCDNGTLTIASPTSATTAFTAPSVNSAICTVAIKVSETALASNSSVTTYFTVTVNGNFGNAQIFAFPNSSPIVTVRGDFRYYFFSDTAPGGIPAQQGDLFFTATDPDGDNVRFDLSGICSDSGFDGAGLLSVGAVPINPANFSAITSSTNTGTGSGTPPASAYSFNPFFGYNTGTRYADPNASCQFKILVSDLCTNGDCGPAGSQGAKTDGADRGGVTTGFLNASAPKQPKRAPTIVRVVVPNQDGGDVGGTPNTWDPRKFVIVQPGVQIHLSLDAEDTFEAGPLTIGGVCNVGAGATFSTTTPGGPKTLHWEGGYTPPATLVADMNCVVTVTSTASGLGTSTTIRFAGSDPCVGAADGTSCDDHNSCTVGEACHGGVCTVPTGTFNVNNGATAPTTGVSGTAACVVPNATTTGQCKVAGTCNANTGTCSDPNANNNTACNADSSGCTVGDSCQAGVCTAGGAPTSCPNPAPNTFCYNTSASPGSICSSTGNNSYTCNWPVTTSATCTAANATTKCNGTVPFLSFACDGTGACVGSGTGSCASGQCSSGGTCNSASGQCSGGTPVAAGTLCDLDGTNCTVDKCDGAGNCVFNMQACPAGQSCTPTTPPAAPICTAPKPVVSSAIAVNFSPPSGIGMDTAGNTYLGTTIFATIPVSSVDFGGGHTVTSGGDSDIAIAKYDVNGNNVWAVGFGDGAAPTGGNPQTANAAVATKNGSVVFYGRSTGSLTIGNSFSSTNESDYIAAVRSTDGGGVWGKILDTGGGVVLAIASNPNHASNRVAICGRTPGAAGIVTPAPTNAGATDLFVAVYDGATGNQVWAKQFGGTGNELCRALAVDDSGNVYAGGWFDSATLAFGSTTLTGPGTTSRQFIWLAKFDGSNGTPSGAASFNGTAGNAVPFTLGVDPTGAVLVAGTFSTNVTFGTTTLTSAGSTDVFIAKLSAALAPSWAVRLGAPTADAPSGIASTSSGDVVVSGFFRGTTTGVAAITSASTTATDAFVLKLDGISGGLQDAKAYGDTATQSADSLAVNRFGTVTDQFAICGTLNGSITFPAVPPTVPSAITITSPVGTQGFLAFGKNL